MEILVTGGAGFLGRWTVKSFLERNVGRVCVLDDLSHGKRDNLAAFKLHKNFSGMIVGDVRDKKIVSGVFGRGLDVCVHLAAIADVGASLADPEKTFDVNLFGTINLLESARKHDVKFVFVSTCMVYESASVPISETHPTKPASPYAASKLAAENIVQSYHNAYGLETVILRPFNVYGPYGLFDEQRGEGGVIMVFLKRALYKQPIMIFGDGIQTRDFSYVEDCADFIVRASVLSSTNGQIINAGSGTGKSINELARLVAKSQNPIYVEHPHPKSEIQRLVCDYAKAKSLLGWTPTVSLEEGILITKNWLASSLSERM